MGELLDLLPFLLILWVLFGGLLGKKKGPAKGQGRAPRQPGGESRERRAPSAQGPARTPAGEAGTGGSAADMLPDELWAVLTGERRSPRPTPVPGDDPDAGSGYESPGRYGDDPGFQWDDGEDAGLEDDAPARSAEDRARELQGLGWGEEAQSLEVPPVHPAPVVVSMEGPPPPPELRHTEFHRRLAKSTVRPPMRIARRRARLPLGTRAHLRRAVILREVIGPPRGLE